MIPQVLCAKITAKKEGTPLTSTEEVVDREYGLV
jgi:hypothetical protein